jgi:hypothetical protein
MGLHKPTRGLFDGPSPLSVEWVSDSVVGGKVQACGTAACFFTTDIKGDLPIATTPTPLPAALPLFATGLGALGLLGWRRKRKARVSLLGAA